MFVLLEEFFEKVDFEKDDKRNKINYLACKVYNTCGSLVPEGKGLTSWRLFVMFIVILLLSYFVS